MKEFVEFKRRIRPELAGEIMRLYTRDTYGFEGDPAELTEEEENSRKAIAEEFSRMYPGLTVEKALWAMEQHIQQWEQSVIKQGECFYAMKTHETRQRYLKALSEITGRKTSLELVDAYILAYKEDKKNG